MKDIYGKDWRPQQGPDFLENGNVRFRSRMRSVTEAWVELNGERYPFPSTGNGWFETEIAAKPGDLYYFFVKTDDHPGGIRVSDPDAFFRPQGVDGPGQLVVIDQTDRILPTGRPFEETIKMEIHIGTFAPSETFISAIDKLPELVKLGMTDVQVMPVFSAGGDRGWGYDVTNHFATLEANGTPQEYAQFVRAAQKLDLTVTQDVVFNHVGPRGDSLSIVDKPFFLKEANGWGKSPDFDGPDNESTRQRFRDIIYYLVNVIGVDGLRFDAAHAIKSQREFKNLVIYARSIVPPGRTLCLVAEHEDHPPELLERDADGNPLGLDGFVDDDLHHLLTVEGTGINKGYYAKYQNPVSRIASQLTENFGDVGRQLNIPPFGGVHHINTHDQQGNTPQGIKPDFKNPKHEIMAYATVMLEPRIPNFFQVPVFGDSFAFFCDHPELAEVIKKGRVEEFQEHGFDNFTEENMLDPDARETYEKSRIDWNPGAQASKSLLQTYISYFSDLRKYHIFPILKANRGWREATREVVDNKLVQASVIFNKHIWQLTANYSDEPVRAPHSLVGQQIYGDALPRDRQTLKPHSIHICIEGPRG